MAHIILVRHGETEANRLGIYQGKITDHFLNLTGNRQAEAVAKTLKDFQIEKIYSSTSMRAIETAENINDYHEKSIFATGKLLEIDHGLFDGKTLEQVKAKYPKILETWWNHPEKVKFPKGETLKGAHRRVTQFINDVINDMTRKIRSGNDSGSNYLNADEYFGNPASQFQKISAHLKYRRNFNQGNGKRPFNYRRQ
ncbi:MAG: Phosphoglycerate mutase family protein [Candidatus Azambacteria bacterium GW2011_GWF2_46_32]|uniref:Phosphoglycerate mutase family protein n=1 Tax=Candidatus Azambacteria bacterium GW2011_GWF2_46_32 TaxID=1618628 RepID=A0A0G1PXB9_9BACT|nr:MAG: Phosphoglycerate mutase family protein [Candidatus Azambacteria bacterium GW2011_GWF2_46_32]